MFVKFSLIGLLIGSVVSGASTEETSIEVGKPAPQFSLKNVDGKDVSLSEFKGKIVVLEWTNPGCPFVVGHYKNGNMPKLQKELAEKGVIWLAINSTNKNHKDYLSPSEFKAQMSEWKANATHYLLDEDGKVGKMYDAKTTPHMFVIDKNGNLAYMGAIDDDRSTNGGKDAKVNYVRKAVEELLSGKEVSEKVTKQYGCSVKY
ncbi:MAG: thioredoxin family protein [Chloroherpetonaceae bacterium]|nr:thioredoxin family protein [Chloroherpetonaceae bacterium]MDW8437202.1 thioredoxin family protein [Chloroherpetonaceae bacterium]